MGAAFAFSPAAHAQNYGVEIEGAPNGLKQKLEIISDLKKGLRDYPTAASLRRAAARDIEAFDKALKAAGYYAGAAHFELIADKDQPTVRFTIDPGPAFEITEYEILYQDEGDSRPISLEEAGVKADGSAEGAALQETQTRFLAYLWNHGYPSAEIISRRAIANIDKGTASAVFVFKSGPKARFGEIEIEGLDKTKPSFVRRLKTWEDGEEFERSKMVDYRNRLAETSLFSAINIAPGAPDETGAAPINLKLDERKRRTIGAGVSYSTTEGPGGRLFFENRNIFGRGENFRIEARASEIEQSINFDITRPWPRLPGLAFANFEFSNETTDAFDARSINLSGGLAKKWLKDRLETRAALALETSNVKAEGLEERTYFVSTPLSVVWSSEDNLLDPQKGFRAAWTITPYTGTDSFTQTEFSARSRIHFGKDNRFTLAGRGALGATFGSSLADLPRNKRLYAGGGGSVRGFGFQEAGPLDADNNPVGGRSSIEAAIEARAKILQNVQLVGFVDAGSVSSNSLPDFNEDFFIGYGGGVRYLTPVGPIRLDVAFPLDKRDSDRGFQIYIALGQAF